jgi:uncharacterized protein YciI
VTLRKKNLCGEAMTVPELTPYYLTLLKTNPDYVPPEDDPKELLHQHLAYGRSLFEAGKMLMSGPTAAPEGELLEGIYIMRAESLEEAKELANGDPAVQANALIPIVCTWYLAEETVKVWAASLA